VCIALDGAGSLMFHGAHRKHGISLPYVPVSLFFSYSYSLKPVISVGQDLIRNFGSPYFFLLLLL
jgi:hypothetical protein